MNQQMYFESMIDEAYEFSGVGLTDQDYFMILQERVRQYNEAVDADEGFSGIGLTDHDYDLIEQEDTRQYHEHLDSDEELKIREKRCHRQLKKFRWKLIVKSCHPDRIDNWFPEWREGLTA